MHVVMEHETHLVHLLLNHNVSLEAVDNSTETAPMEAMSRGITESAVMKREQI